MDDLLDDLNEKTIYQEASKEKRFLNLIIDYLVFLLFIVIIGIISLVVQPNLFLDEYNLGAGLEYLITGSMMILYYTGLEYLLKGKTIGKYLTKTRAVNEDNSRMDFITTLKRSLFRLIPFEPLTFLGARGLHDSLSHTKVIQDQGWSEYD